MGDVVVIQNYGVVFDQQAAAFEGVGWGLGIEPRERLVQPSFEDDLSIVVALGEWFARGDVGAVKNGVAQAL